MPVIEVNHVSKTFKRGQLETLKAAAKRVFSRSRSRSKSAAASASFNALDDVDFSIEAGEVVGVIGHNGAGKSTLLKILSRITVPSAGRAVVNGSVAPLIEVGAGLVGDLTGRENIYLNAAILGIPKREIARRFDDIVAFAELEEFIDTPVKRYSSGMAVRLGFSIATSVDADILIVDEVLAVGDLAFQRKCFDRMEELTKKQGRTLLLVTHNVRQAERMCRRVLLLDHGRLVRDGGARDVCNAFLELNNERLHKGSVSSVRTHVKTDTNDLRVVECELWSPELGRPVEQVIQHEGLGVSVTFDVLGDMDDLDVVIGFHTADSIYVSTATTGVLGTKRPFRKGRHRVGCSFPDVPLMPGVYGVRVGFLDQFAREIWYAENCRTFRVAAPDINAARASTISLVDLPVQWSFAQCETRVDAPAELEVSA